MKRGIVKKRNGKKELTNKKLDHYNLTPTSGKWAFGQAHLVPAVIWAGTKGLVTRG
jgi:hypothetical protein